MAGKIIDKGESKATQNVAYSWYIYLNTNLRRPIMARSPIKTAEIISALYDETFAKNSFEPFRIKWNDMRGKPDS